MIKRNNVIDINIKRLVGYIMRKIWIVIILAAIFALGVGYYTSNYIKPYYISSSKLFILNKQVTESSTMTDLQVGSVLTQDYMVLIKSRPVMQQVIRMMNLDMSVDSLANLISISTLNDTRILGISAKYGDAKTAKLLVDTVAKVSSQSIIKIMGIDNVNVVEEGNYPTTPAGPNVNRNTRLAAVIGGFVATFVLCVIYLLNDTIKSTEDIEQFFGLVVLGSIPYENPKQGNVNKWSKKHKEYVVA